MRIEALARSQNPQQNHTHKRPRASSRCSSAGPLLHNLAEVAGQSDVLLRFGHSVVPWVAMRNSEFVVVCESIRRFAQRARASATLVEAAPQAFKPRAVPWRLQTHPW